MNSLPKITLAFLAVVAALIIIFIGTRSKTETAQIEAPIIKHVVTDIPVITSPEAVALPDFASYADVKEKKSAFFNYLLPLVKYSNQLVQVDRERFKRVQSDPINLCLLYTSDAADE